MNGFSQRQTPAGPASSSSSSTQPFHSTFAHNGTADDYQRSRPEFRSIYDDSEEFFENPRLFSGRSLLQKPSLVSVGEVYNDTSSGYSTASSIPSTNTHWARKENNEFEFVPIKEEEPQLNRLLSGPDWRNRISLHGKLLFE